MTIDHKNDKHIIADEGKTFRRISDKKNYGTEVYLGYSYYLNGEKLDVPVFEKPEDFEEVDYTPEIKTVMREISSLPAEEKNESEKTSKETVIL